MSRSTNFAAELSKMKNNFSIDYSVSYDEVRDFLLYSPPTKILDEFNNVKTFLYDNCTEVVACSGDPEIKDTELNKCIDVMTMLQILEEAEKSVMLKSILMNKNLFMRGSKKHKGKNIMEIKEKLKQESWDSDVKLQLNMMNFTRVQRALLTTYEKGDEKA